ncbi:acyl-CoA thioesterase [Streptomyces sp. NPDC056002]|uniref:acyl-CoA thioesterase n=1 Tax=Streptomyces sp. NPDC056002 TaxID=3345675 RepID=UPI0035D59615
MYRTGSTAGGGLSADPLLPHTASSLVDFLTLERLELDLFRGWCHSGVPGQAFGGQVVAQSLAAAGHTVEDDRPVHSLHGNFLRAGDLRCPIVYSVERLRDGRRYSARRVTAVQAGQVIFTLSASFKYPEEEPDRQPAMPQVPEPEDVPDAFLLWKEHRPEQHRAAGHAQVVSLRVVPPRPEDAPQGDGGQTRQHVWFRTLEPLPEDPKLHACALTYLSDLTLGSTSSLDREVLYPLRTEPTQLILASLDHGVWFHRPFRADEWLLHSQRSISAGDGRGFNLGEFWTRDGRLVASTVQETALRTRGPRP